MFSRERFVLLTVFLCEMIWSPVEAYFITQITEPGISVQALRYDSKEDVLYFSDTETKTIHRYSPFTLQEQILQIGQRSTFIIPVQDVEFSFLASFDRDIVFLRWDYNAGYDNYEYEYFPCLLATVEPLCHGNRWNAGIVDSRGRFWGGTLTILDPPDCQCQPTFYRADTTLPDLLEVDVAIQSFYSNGVGFSGDYRLMFNIDFYNRQIYEFRFDVIGGTMCCPRVVFRYDDYGLVGVPDGLAVDTDNNLWIGSFNGSQVIQVNPGTGELLQTVDMPVSMVTDLAFGGPFMDVLYVGTFRPDDGTLEPGAGAVFAVTDLGVSGVPPQEAMVNNFCKPTYYHVH